MAYTLPAPALAQRHSIVTAVSGGGFEQARVDAAAPSPGSGSFGGSTLYWLDHWLDRDDTADTVQTYPTSQAGTASTVTQPNPPDGTSSLALPAGIPSGTRLLVSKGAPGSNFGEQLATTGGPSGANTIVSPALVAGNGTQVEYWEPTSTTGRVFPALKLDGSNNAFEAALLRSGDMFFRASILSVNARFS